MTKITVLMLALLVSACGKEFRVKEEFDCSKHSAELAKFIVDCAKSANPLSDEEGEDLVAQCEKTARRTYCTRQENILEYRDGNCYSESNKVASCY